MAVAPFVVALALWLTIPAAVGWMLSANALLSVTVAALLLLLLPVAASLAVAHLSLHPSWHKPGSPPAAEPLARGSDDADSSDSAFEAEEHAGVLGELVGAAVQYYAGATSNPLHDFGLAYRNVRIACSDDWTRKGQAANNSNGSAKRKTSDPEATRLLGSSSVSGAASSEYVLRGWYVPASRKGQTLVLLVHGAGRDRRTFMRHLPLFHSAGYAALLIDCREHGCSSRSSQSAKKRPSVGFTTRESLDVIHAARFAKRVLGYEKIVACGTSQGGAAVIVAAVLADELDTKAEKDLSGAKKRNANNGASAPASPSTAAGPVISCVIAENPFASRESCVSEVMTRVLGRLPTAAWATPLRALRAGFISCAVLALRWRLGLFHLSRPQQWRVNWQRASCGAQHASGRLSHSGHSQPSPSSAHLPLPPLFSAASPLSSLAHADLNAIDVVDRISPRPLLLLHGLRDAVITPDHSQALFARARDPKKLWLAADAHHTALINVAPDEWRDTVIGFLKQHGF